MAPLPATAVRLASRRLLKFAGPRRGHRGCGAVGSATRSHRVGQGFDSPQLHQITLSMQSGPAAPHDRRFRCVWCINAPQAPIAAIMDCPFSGARATGALGGRGVGRASTGQAQQGGTAEKSTSTCGSPTSGSAVAVHARIGQGASAVCDAQEAVLAYADAAREGRVDPHQPGAARVLMMASDIYGGAAGLDMAPARWAPRSALRPTGCSPRTRRFPPISVGWCPGRRSRTSGTRW